jgi:hypothetical protein
MCDKFILRFPERISETTLSPPISRPYLACCFAMRAGLAEPLEGCEMHRSSVLRKMRSVKAVATFLAALRC